jgi:hypothetical protein
MRFMIIRKAVTRWPPIDGHGEVEIEIRQVYELSDLGSAEAMEPLARLRERMTRELTSPCIEEGGGRDW